MSVLPLLPLLIPLAGTFLVALLPSRDQFLLLRRWIHIAILLLTLISLLVANTSDVKTIKLAFLVPSYVYGGAIQFAIDPLASSLALLSTGTLLLASLAMSARPMLRFEAINSLILSLAAIGVCIAADLLTLCMMWFLVNLAILSIEIIRAPDESIPHAMRNAFGNLLSAITLIIATMIVMVERGDVRFSSLNISELPLFLLMLTAILRLRIYPLPASLKRRWEAFLASLCTGGYLWLRATSLTEVSLPAGNWLIPFGGATLLITGLLASLSLDFASALPYILAHGIATIMLAPLMLPTSGSSVAFLTTINLGLCLTLLRIDVQIRTVPPLGRWARLPLIVALASLAGWPFTLGLIAHWEFLRLSLITEWQRFMLVGSISYLLISVPIWRRLYLALREVREKGAAPNRAMWLAIGSAGLIAVLLVVFGLSPSLFGLSWRGTSTVFRLEPFRNLFSGGLKGFGLLLLSTLVVPVLGSYGLQRIAGFPSRVMQGLEITGTLLELDWLYALVERAFERLHQAVERILLAVEEAFYLGWTLLWGLIIILYLARR